MEAAPERKFVESVDISFTIKDVDLKNPTTVSRKKSVFHRAAVVNSRWPCLQPVKLPPRPRLLALRSFTSGHRRLRWKERSCQKGRQPIRLFPLRSPAHGLIGRHLGTVLGPRGKMPRPVPPTLDPAILATGLASTVVVKSGDKMTFHASFGTVKQSHDELLANAMEVFNRVTNKLERGIGNIRSLYIKTSMGPSQRIEVIN